MKSAFLLLALLPLWAAAQESPAPIIDVHLHAGSASAQGPPPVAMCAPGHEWASWDPAEPWSVAFLRWLKEPACEAPIWSPMTDQELFDQTLEVLERRNIYAVTSGAAPILSEWRASGSPRFLPGFWFGQALRSFPTPDELRETLGSGDYVFFGEVAIQYDGMSPSDSVFDPYLAVVEDLDLPMGIHIGVGPPGAPHLYPVFRNYRARLHSPLVLEEALMRHPGLRVTVMHAGWPMVDDLMALLWAHPQVYASVGAISYVLPRAEFHRFLQRLVEAGFGKRIMFGSDQMVWPGAIEVGIESIEAAPFLTESQKRDLLFNNAARFLRLDEETIARMHRGG